jgi:hypothetical protein
MISMKKGVFAFLITLCLNNFTYAANGFIINYLIMNNSYNKIKGFAVTKSNDTIRGYFYICNTKNRAVIYHKDSIIHKKDMDSVFKMGVLKSVFLENSRSFSSHILVEYTYIDTLGFFCHKVYTGNAEYFDNNFSMNNLSKTCRDVYILFKSGKLLLVDPYNNYINRYMFSSSFKLLIDFYNKNYCVNKPCPNFKTSLEVIKKIDEHL